MKNNVGIWCDGSRAVIVKLNNNSVTEILANIDNKVHHEQEGDKGTFVGGGKHINNEKTFDERKKNQTKAYLKNIISEISDAEGIYVFGPAEIKTQLKKELEETNGFANKLTSVESADKMTDNQIVAAVKKHFVVTA